MNPIDDKVPREDKVPRDEDHRFDLLVDGELSEAERRELLSGLDDRPGGWRRCALAFLEAQAWGQEFGSMLREPAERATAVRLARRRWLGLPGGTLMAMAASFLVALFLGLMLREAWQPAGPAGPGPMQIAGVSPGVEDPVERPGDAEGVSPEIPGPSDTPASPWRMVELASTGEPGGDAEPFQLPAIERESFDGEWLESVPPGMSDEALSTLKRSGYRVQRRRALLPFRMKDGRRLVVPVDNYDVHYVGNPL